MGESKKSQDKSSIKLLDKMEVLNTGMGKIEDKIEMKV